MNEEGSPIQPIPPEDLERREYLESCLIHSDPRRSVMTSDQQLYTQAQQVLRENGVKPVVVKVTEKDFNGYKAIYDAVQEAIGSDKAAELIDKYGDNFWVSDAIENPDESGVDVKSFAICVEVAANVPVDNIEYSNFSNELRSITQHSGLATVLYAPSSDQFHNEFRVRSVLM
jgi:hypothetical protein